MPKPLPPEKARQGKLGRPVLVVLIAALVLAMVVWAGVEFWGERIDTPAADDAGGISTDSN
ncbi:hypothetical protein [Kumtagia ephedrae]|jgi:hypothetical protein|uniref:Uncharacterized protein n=1 Tax=Kumtagia ephedrae TaxID=2116701 RepID=A0A2P7SLQ0_9HYPH|nr:hypothetical protein [Mesorhizobium ephedrae]PSJ63419.1 hypothetical protein C7I84_07260 [Mesorhizobium ephedrae]